MRALILFFLFLSETPSFEIREDLREEIGDFEALGDESEQALESFAFFRVELAVKKRSDADVIWIVVEVGVRTDPEHHCRRLA